MADFLFRYDAGTHLTAFVLGSVRLTVFAAIAPFMGSAVVTGTAKAALVLALYLVLHPALLTTLPVTVPLDGEETLLLGGLIVKEAFLGFVLGWLSGLVFWAVESAGIFVDNQRGAGAASETNVLSGGPSSPTGGFLFQSVAYAFFATGTFAAFLALLYASYESWPVGEFLPAVFFEKTGAALYFGERFQDLAMRIILISAPVVLACLFTDIGLGIINRFAPQLNVYILSLSVKSALASFLLIFYFGVLMTDAPERFAGFGTDLSQLRLWFR